jgi:hypothetical protein
MKNPITLREIERIVCDGENISARSLHDDSQKGEFVFARQIIWYIAHFKTNLTGARLGSYFNGRDHATVLHGVKQIQNYIDTNTAIRKKVEDYILQVETFIEVPGKINSIKILVSRLDEDLNGLLDRFEEIRNEINDVKEIMENLVTINK